MNYYTCFPICPFCLEPSIKSSHLIQDEHDLNRFTCPNCGNHFKNLMKLENDKNFSFPLFSEVKLNSIEKSYVDWIINGEITGKYFITWPWDEVKFIPILLSEYYLNIGEDKIVVLYKKLDSDKFNDINYPLVLNHIYHMDKYFDDMPRLLTNEDVFIENLQGFCKIFVNTLDNNNIDNFQRIESNLNDCSLIADDLAYYNDLTFQCGFVDNNKNCFKEFIKTFKVLFGNDAIKKVTGFEGAQEFNEEGIFELNFFTEYAYDKNLRINKDFCNAFNVCYNNKFDLLPSFSNITYSFINSEEELHNVSENCKLFFIDQDIFSKKINEFIQDINPKWIISPWISELLAKSRYNTALRKEVFSLLGSNNNLLLFSTDLNRRNEYKIGKPNNFLKNLNITPHTWDYKDILDFIREEDENHVTLFSSDYTSVHGENYSLDIKFQECSKLKLMDDCLKIFDEIFLGDRQVIKIIKELIRTPLFIKGDYKKRFKHYNLNLEYLLAIIFSHSEEKGKIVRNALDDIYGWLGENKNPLLDAIISLINNDDFNNQECAIVTHHFDYKELKEILSEIIPNNQILVTRWNKLNDEIKNTKVHRVIATEFPTKTYKLYDSPLDEIILLGSPETINEFKFYKNSRFTEKGTKPIYLLNENECAPDLLKNSLNQIEIDYEDIVEFNEEINKINYEHQDNKKYQLSSVIKKGMSCVLVLNENNEAMFLPYKDVYIYTDSGVKTIHLASNHNNYVKLSNTKILINKHKMYDSFGRHFFKFVIDNDETSLLPYGGYQWIGFKDLIENMFEWARLLNKIVSIECYKRGNSDRNLIKKDLEDDLKELGVYAQSKNYIKNYWLDEPVPLKTDKGEILIYEIERPMYKEDLYKIYEWILDNYEGFEISSLDAFKSFAAAKYIQNVIRPKFFNNTIPEGHILKGLCDEFQAYIADKIEESNIFEVIEVKQVKIKKEVKSYIIYNNYGEYIGEGSSNLNK